MRRFAAIRARTGMLICIEHCSVQGVLKMASQQICYH